MSKQRVVSNLLIMVMGRIGTWGLSLVYVALTSRYLGPTRLGELTQAGAIVALLGLVVEMGMGTLIVRTVARTPERAGVLASAAMMVRGVLVIPALIGLYVYTQVAHLNAETQLAAYIMAVGMIFSSLADIMVSTFLGREQMSYGAILEIANNAFSLAFALVVMWWHGGIAAFAAIGVLIQILLLAVNMRWVRRFAHLTRHVAMTDVREVIVGSLAFWAKNVFLTIYIYIDSLILAGLAGSAAVGIYAPATRLFSVALFFPGIIAMITLPQLSRLGVDPGADFARVGRKILSVLIVCAIPLTVGLATFAGPLIMAFFGPSYRLSISVLVALSLCVLPTFMNVQLSQTLVARDQQWRWTVVMAVSCVVNPLFNLALIPLAGHRWHNPALGAALALLITESLMAVYGVVALRDVLFERSLGRAVLGALIAGAAQIAAIWLLSSLWLPLGEAVGVIVYALLAIALGAFPRDDIALLLETVMQYPRRLLDRRANTSVLPATVAEPMPPGSLDG